MYKRQAFYWRVAKRQRIAMAAGSESCMEMCIRDRYGSDNLALAPWQNFGYSLKWQKEYSTEKEKQDYVSAINDNNEELAKMERWPNSALLYTKPAEVTSTLNEFAQAQLFKFVTGERKMDEWDDYVQEWLQQGGKETIESAAEQLGVPVPDGI